MKALILAAGLGTRLLPYTQAIPKPLFTLISSPMLEHLIQKLVDIGCKQIVINTHHLHEQIKNFVMQNRYRDIIHTIHEPVILDTGGAIANAEPFLGDHPFFVINSDIISNIDLKKAYNLHEQSNCLATLVLHDHDNFNKVEIDDSGYIQGFDAKTRGLAFTGVQILSPEIFACFPDKKIFSSIEVYKNLCKTKQVKALIDKNIFWSDIGTKDSYSRTSLLLLAATQFKIDQGAIKNIQVDRLAGDGSDRNWYRVKYNDRSLIVSDHDICLPQSDGLLQINAFIHIGNHLSLQSIPVPHIYNYDKLSGMVILEDLGDIHLETRIKEKNSDKFTLKLYKKVIDELIGFSIKGSVDFNKDWTYQTPTYSKELILEKECGYFMEEFIQNYRKLNFSLNDFVKEFNHIADHALKNGFIGLMHRDMQSRNIMVRNSKIYFIDFQGARSGPLQYDLASLLIDPYVNLKDQIKDELLQYAIEKLKLSRDKKEKFLQCYHYCSLTRSMQILGAFSFLSQTKKRKKFEQYIPDSIKGLKKLVTYLNMDNKIPELSKLIRLL